MQVKATNQYGNFATYHLNDNISALISVTGLNPPTVNISTSPIATKDGSIFTNAQAENRNIVLTFAATGPNPGALRTALYFIFKVKEPISLEIKANGRTANIDGYVESISADPFAKKQRVQVSIICPDPYFLSEEQTHVVIYPQSNIVTFSDTAHGAIFELNVSGSITGGLTIGNALTGQNFTIDGDYQSGDKITLDTRQGLKALTLTRNGETTNILQYMNATEHDWLQLIPYDNNLITLSSSNCSGLVRWQTHYEGV